MAPAKPRRRWLRRLTVLAAVVGLAFGTTAVLEIPSPPELIRLQTTDPSAQGTAFASRPVMPSGQIGVLPADPTRHLPDAVPWKGARIPVSEMLEITHSRAFVVLHEGKLVHEWYADGVAADTQLASWSVAKSVVSLLVGQAIGRGDLSERDRLVDLLPELRTGGAYDEVTVGDLLDMASGIDVSENYNPWWPFTGTARLLLSTDLPGYVADNRELAFTPGSRAEYRSIDPQLLSMILARIDGRPLARILRGSLDTDGRRGRRHLEPGSARRHREGVLLPQRNRARLRPGRSAGPGQRTYRGYAGGVQRVDRADLDPESAETRRLGLFGAVVACS
ncbi:MAG: serine hydrolase [Micropruina sp.]